MTLPPSYWAAQARAELAAARERHCSHGVPRDHCREDHPAPTDEETT